ncbi:pyridoxamine 5'-phosphate oxidase family protein [Hufsiella ginkgonis]|uniref:Pyridoxamine 5'-phosphate oxidase family protein n=1 Tax=Hufsiella ginkgonis TaxID=2695274 RepID=A0A7K1XUD3_9SPHI|nr:pyridoxamine 5'-phosphate oxidase family protein [Hufsiella ginkgonis]MXV14623.1 pyridoxamine 5'-phosphate oxidase family protein [Hufsiella ginkgonis]
MGKFFDIIEDSHVSFINNQRMFFVGSAPLSGDGHVNISPKGLDSFRVLSPSRVAYLDITGSGNETSAHILENGRITFMFCAFEGPPNILRLYGKGTTILPGNPEWEALIALFAPHPSTRQIITGEIHKVQTSCGFGIPFYDYIGERDFSEKWAEKKGPEGILKYQADKNVVSIDGLPTALATL